MLDELLKTCNLVVNYGEEMLEHLPETKCQLFAEMLDTLKEESSRVQKNREELADRITNTRL